MKVEYNGNGYKAEMGGMVSSVNMNGVGTNAPDISWIEKLRNGVVLSIVGLIFSFISLMILLVGFVFKDNIINLNLINLLTVYGIANIVISVITIAISIVALVFIKKNTSLAQNVKTVGIICGLVAIVLVVFVAAMIPGTFLIV